MNAAGEPLISVVVPSFNQAHYLKECLESIVRQDYPHKEIIVMDGGSTDGSADVIASYSDELAYWQSAPDGGQTDAIDQGFHRASGQVLGWLNSDDLLVPGALTRVARAFGGDPGVRWIYGNSYIVNRESATLTSRIAVPVTIEDLVSLSYYLPQESTYFRRDLYFEVGGLDESLHYAMDYDLWLKLAAAAPPRHVPEFIGCFRYLPDQKSADTAAYRKEERAVKTRFADRRLPPLPRLTRYARLRWLVLHGRLSADGWEGLVRSQLRKVSRRGPRLGVSLVESWALLAALLVTPIGTLWALARLYRRWFGRSTGSRSDR